MDRLNVRSGKDQFEYLRGIAILFVLTTHFSLENEFFAERELSSPFYSGVELFFLISGYGIAASLLSRPFDWRKYVLKRCRRIYPSLLAMLAACFLVNLLMQHMELNDWAFETYVRTNDMQWVDSLRILSGTYILGNGGEYAFGPMWYLSVQMQFYAVMGVLAALAKSEVNRRKLLFAAAGLICVVCLACRISVLAGSRLIHPLLRYIIGWRIDIPFWGVLLYGAAERLPKAAVATPSPQLSRLLSVLLLCVPVLVLMRTGSDMSTLDGNPLLTGFGYPVCILCYGLLVLLCATGRKTFLPQKSRVLAYLSSRSYLLYLYNLLGLLLGWLVINQFFPQIFYTGSYLHYGVAQLFIGGFFIVALAEADYQLIEKRLIQNRIRQETDR